MKLFGFILVDLVGVYNQDYSINRKRGFCYENLEIDDRNALNLQLTYQKVVMKQCSETEYNYQATLKFKHLWDLQKQKERNIIKYHE